MQGDTMQTDYDGYCALVNERDALKDHIAELEAENAREHSEYLECRQVLLDERDAEQAELARLKSRNAILQVTAEQMLSCFWVEGHPGEPALRSDWIRKVNVDGWRSHINNK